MGLGDLQERSLGDLSCAASLFQSPFWAFAKARNGWSHRVFSLHRHDPFLVLLKRWGPLGIGYIPGVQESHIPHTPEDLASAAALISRRAGGLFLLRYDSALKLDQGVSRSMYQSSAAVLPGFDIQPVDTVIIDTAQRPGTGYRQRAVRHITQAQRSGVTCCWDQSRSFFAPWYQLYRETARRSGFYPRSGEYLMHLLTYGGSHVRPKLAVAKRNGVIEAGAIVLVSESSAWYLYGATGSEGLSHGSMYALQDWIIRELHQGGVKRYDLYGTAPLNVQHHHLASLTLFKRSFGGEHLRTLGLIDCPQKTIPYRMFRFGEHKRITRARGACDPDFLQH